MMSIENGSDLVDTTRTALIGSTGTTYSFYGMPYAELAGLLTAIYIVCKIIIASPQLFEVLKKYKDKLFNRKT